MCGILSKLDTPEFESECHKYYVICMSETKCDDADIDTIQAEFKNMEFEVYIKNRHKLTRWKLGGVLVAVSDNLNRNCRSQYLKST